MFPLAHPVVILCSLALGQPAAPPPPLIGWPADQAEAYRAFEGDLVASASPDSLRAFHDLLASEPHIAGSPGDLRQADRIAAAFTKMGLEVEKHEIFPYLARPTACVIEVLHRNPVEGPTKRSDGTQVEETWKTTVLSNKEQILPEDAYSGNSELTFGWNAYSGSGEVTAEVVYANYGTKADFEQLAKLGVDVHGKIVLARYGHNFRGHKARFAEAAGAAGLIIFTDPSDGGYAKGLMYPEGGWANDTCIERGSVSTLDYPGDPLTPGVVATKYANRLDPASVPLAKIPVQPIGYGAARQIIGRMKGTAPLLPDGWQGGLEFPYRILGGPDLKVHLKVEQVREITRTFNVIGTLRGAKHLDQKVLVGSHHDAWGFGACDPTCGTIVTLETARVFAEMAKNGHPPARTMVFCTWGAEEFSIIGSTEWVEAHREDLTSNGIAYINLDMSSMGTDFGASAAPSLKSLIIEATKCVPQPGATDGKTVFDAWLAKNKEAKAKENKEAAAAMTEPKFGDLGGGSDHVGFYCLAGIPSAGYGGSGALGTAYHSVYDTLTWYRHVVGEDYQPALMVTRVNAIVLSRLANSPMLPFDYARMGADTKTRLHELIDRATALGIEDAAKAAFGPVEEAAAKFQTHATTVRDSLLGAAGRDWISPEGRRKLNELSIFNQVWLVEQGLPGRPWYRNLFAAPDEDSGYAAWTLPAFSRAVERKDTAALNEAREMYLSAFRLAEERLSQVEFLTPTGDRKRTPKGVDQ